MASTILINGEETNFSWQADQSLKPDSLVDLFTKATNETDTLVPESTVGTGSDTPPAAPAAV